MCVWIKKVIEPAYKMKITGKIILINAFTLLLIIPKKIPYDFIPQGYISIIYLTRNAN